MSSIELVSVHVPKTAGTSFRAILDQVYGADRVYTVYPTPNNRATLLRTHEEWLADSVALCRAGRSGPRVVHGHFLMKWYADRFPHAPAITWLRDPVDRIASFYFMWREMAPWPTASPLQQAVRRGDLDLLAFARAPAIRDQVTRQFVGSSAGRGLSFIGIQERFDDDVARLGRLLGWPPVQVPRENVNVSAAYRDRSVDGEMRAAIAALNPADTSLYQAVVEGRWRKES